MCGDGKESYRNVEQITDRATQERMKDIGDRKNSRDYMKFLGDYCQ
jgi:hypothetical protein